MLPKEYFDDPLTEGVAFEHVLDNRFTLLKLPVGLRQDGYCDAGC